MHQEPEKNTGEIGLQSFTDIDTSLKADSIEEYEQGIKKLNELAVQGVISSDESQRRAILIMEYMEVEDNDQIMVTNNVPTREKTSRILTALDSVANGFAHCLTDCFLGRYEVDDDDEE